MIVYIIIPNSNEPEHNVEQLDFYYQNYEDALLDSELLVYKSQIIPFDMSKLSNTNQIN